MIPNDDHINTRFLLVWDESPLGSFQACTQRTSGNVHTSSAELDAELRYLVDQGIDVLDS